MVVHTELASTTGSVGIDAVDYVILVFICIEILSVE